MDLTIAHRILGVNSFSNKDQVKNSYKKLVKKWHPDRHIDDKIKYAYAEENIKKIIEAYKYLLNHNSWESRDNVKKFREKQNSTNYIRYDIKNIFFKIVNFITIVFQYLFVLLGLPFVIFWYHPIHTDLFPFLHDKSMQQVYNFDKSNLELFFNDPNSIGYFEKDSLMKETKISLDSFIDLLNIKNKSVSINYIDLDDDGFEELIMNLFSTISDEYHHSIMLFNYGNNKLFNFIKSFKNGTILDYNNKVFIEPLSTFDSFYFCDTCYFSQEIINNKKIKYISPKVKYIYQKNIIYYQGFNKLLNKKIISNLKLLNQLNYKINDNQFDNGIRRLYAENILCYYYNNFDLNSCRDLFYQYYRLSDQHIVWKGIVIELIKKYPVINNIDEVI